MFRRIGLLGVILIALYCLAHWTSERRTTQRLSQAREDLSRWEGEGGSGPPNQSGDDS